ncbi:hypothetical protein [Bacteroides faecium]|nr:hypothetical protein [Bacteroides faecium]
MEEENYSLPQYAFEIEFEWEKENEESIHKVCPRTFNRWWGNDVF